MNAPILTFRSNVTPYSLLSSQAYTKATPGGTNLPVAQGDNSDDFYIRIYNNWGLSATIATALNISLTTFDGASSISHTYSTAPVSQHWLHVLENGYGEGATTPGAFTSYVGTDTAVGGVSVYNPEKGSDGVLGESRIRAGTDTNGVGFIEINSYMSVPLAAVAGTYTLAISVQYEYIP
jgi:hypothetical protein